MSRNQLAQKVNKLNSLIAKPIYELVYYQPGDSKKPYTLRLAETQHKVTEKLSSKEMSLFLDGALHIANFYK